MDECEVAQAYRTYAAAVLGRCRRILRDDQAARDVTQETFVRCFDHRHGLRPGRELLSWLYRVATNLCLNALRDARVRRAFEQEQPPQEGAAAEEPHMAALARALLCGLDERTQAIVVYVYLDGMTQAEAAAVAGVTDRTVRNCLSRFLAHGRRELGLDLQEEYS